MTQNDILRRLRYILGYDDQKMCDLTSSGGAETTIDQVTAWLRREDDPAYQECGDRYLAAFLDGLIVERRGAREGVPPSKPARTLNNNMILMKIKIAFDLKAEDVIEILALAGVSVSKHELSAFSRKPDHKHYRECKDQMLRNFLKGLQTRLRP